jgi:hypothetical protein
MDQYYLRSSDSIQQQGVEHPVEEPVRARQNKKQVKKQHVQFIEGKAAEHEKIAQKDQNEIADQNHDSMTNTEDNMQVDDHDEQLQQHQDQTKPSDHSHKRGRPKKSDNINSQHNDQMDTSPSVATDPSMMFVITDRNMDIGDGKVAEMEPLLDEQGMEVDVSQTPRRSIQRRPLSPSQLLEVTKNSAYGSDFST